MLPTTAQALKELETFSIIENFEARKDNFTKALLKINKVLSTHHLQLVVLDDDIYCACEYTILLLEQSLTEELIDSWMGNGFEIYL